MKTLTKVSHTITAKGDTQGNVVFSVRKGSMVTGQFRARLRSAGSRSVGSAFTARLARSAFGMPVDISGRVFEVDRDSLVGEDKAIKLLRKSPFLTLSTTEYGVLYNLEASGVRFLDDKGARLSYLENNNQSKYVVKESKVAV